MTLTPCQEKAARAFFRFLLSDEREFNISGPAGTGKTFLLQHLVGRVIRDYEGAARLIGSEVIAYEIVLTATTNKAAEVLARATGMATSTIHSHLALEVRKDRRTGESRPVPTRRWKVHSRQLVFIDEASMIDARLHAHIGQGFDASCKIVYLGDHCQMAPVQEAISPIYRGASRMVTLSRPMRNAGQPALVALCRQLRRTVETMVFRPITPVPGVIDRLAPHEAQRFIDTTFRVEGADARILAYTNARVQEYNRHIRELRGHPELFTPGERVINNAAIGVGTRMLRVEEEFEIGHVDPAIERVILPGAVMEAYALELVPPAGGGSCRVRVPVDPEHFKALVRHYARIRDWSTVFHLQETYPDLRPKDAATVYKAQGATCGTVFLDLADLGRCTRTDQLARMLYVGASRATTRLLLFGELPERLFVQSA